MEIKKKLEIRSYGAKLIFESKLKDGRCGLVYATILKMVKLHQLAKSGYLYPYITLSELLDELYKLKFTMNKLIRDFESLLDQKSIKVTDFDIPVIGVYEARIGLPMIAEFIEAIDIYDRLNCILLIASRSNLFKKDAHKFFGAVARNRSRIHGFCLKTLSVKKRNFDKVTIRNYIDQDQVYLDAAKEEGEISPAALFAALNIPSFPWLSTKDRNQIFYKLKHME